MNIAEVSTAVSFGVWAAMELREPLLKLAQRRKHERKIGTLSISDVYGPSPINYTAILKQIMDKRDVT